MRLRLRIKGFSNVDTTEGPIWQKLVLFAMPILLTNFLQQLYNTIDMIIVGNFAGDTALGAVGSTGSVTNLLVALFLGISTGTSVIVSRYYASGDYKRLYRTVHVSVLIGILNGFLLLVLGLLATEPVLRLMNTPEVLLPEAVAYMKIVFIGMVPTSIYNMVAAILRAVGDSKRPLYFLAISALLNLTLDLIFVLGFNMGVEGAAIATFIAQSLSAILGIITLVRSEAPYRLFLKELRFHVDEAKEVLSIGIPAGLQSVVVSTANTLVQSQINTYGPHAVEGNAAEGRVGGFLYMTVNSFSLALTTFVGQNLGAKKYHRVKKAVKLGLFLGSGIVMVLGLVIFVFRYEVLSFFNVHENSIPYAVQMLTFSCLLYFLFGIGDILSGALRGAGKSVFPMLSALINMFLVRTLWVFIAQAIYPNVLSVFTAYPISWLTMAVTMVLYYRSGRWMPDDMKKYLQVEK